MNKSDEKAKKKSKKSKSEKEEKDKKEKSSSKEKKDKSKKSKSKDEHNDDNLIAPITNGNKKQNGIANNINSFKPLASNKQIKLVFIFFYFFVTII